MIDRLGHVDPTSAADHITAEYVEMAVWEALDSLRSPGAGEFFGRIDEPSPSGTGTDEWYIGRRHIEDEHHEPVAVDWRAPISAPFYRATAVDPLGGDVEDAVIREQWRPRPPGRLSERLGPLLDGPGPRPTGLGVSECANCEAVAA